MLAIIPENKDTEDQDAGGIIADLIKGQLAQMYTIRKLSRMIYTEKYTIYKRTQRAQTSAKGAQFLDFQNLPLAKILL